MYCGISISAVSTKGQRQMICNQIKYSGVGAFNMFTTCESCRVVVEYSGGACTCRWAARGSGVGSCVG
jgi:hypothetical protein